VPVIIGSIGLRISERRLIYLIVTNVQSRDALL
jgi:hypothetical protein